MLFTYNIKCQQVESLHDFPDLNAVAAYKDPSPTAADFIWVLFEEPLLIKFAVSCDPKSKSKQLA